MNDRFILSGKHFPRSREQEILVPLNIMGVWKNDQNFIVNKCASPVTLFVQALSLELAGERNEIITSSKIITMAFQVI